MRAIWCPGADRWVGLGDYIAGIKLAKANPDASFRHSLQGWYSCKGRDIMREFMGGLHDRISQAVPFHLRGKPEAPPPNVPRGRKWSDDWQRAARHVANKVNMARVIVRPSEIPLEFRARLAHRLTHHWEE